ncbi:MAG: MFS transporter [Lachnospiraceae bacterium]|nr:MFS transporter [Lachnospiraceae bacterium]
MKFKMTKDEKRWILYDVGNSAFTLLITTIMPIYFNAIASDAGLSDTQYLAYWGYAASLVTLIVAFIGPIFGTLTDTKGFKKPVFATSVAIGAIGCVLLGFSKNWILFLILFIVAKVGYTSSLIFYDAMLNDVTTEDRADQVSSAGYAWGYIGSCLPFVVCLALILGGEKIGITMDWAMFAAFMITTVWWVGMTIPLLIHYKQKHFMERSKNIIGDSFKQLGSTFANIGKEKKIFLFLLAFFFYIDGVYTIIDMAIAYGEALGLDSSGLLLALLVSQIVAFPFAILFGKLANKYKTDTLITVCIVAYIGISVFAIFLSNQVQFWILAVLVGMFQGGIQALSRSYLSKIIPANQSGEYFGLYDICGKGAAFLGTTLVGIVAQLTNSINKGISVIAVVFIFGLIVFRIAAKQKGIDRENA